MTQDKFVQPHRSLLVELWGDSVGFGLFRSAAENEEKPYFVARTDLNFGEGPDDYQESASFQEPFEAVQALVPRSLLPSLVITIMDVSFFETLHRLLAIQAFVFVATDTSRPGLETYKAIDSGLPTSSVIVVDLGVLVRPEARYLLVDLRGTPSVANLLDEVWTSGRLNVSKYSYGVEWTLINSRTCRVLEPARMGDPVLRGKPVSDSRLIAEVGIQPGDVLVVCVQQRA